MLECIHVRGLFGPCVIQDLVGFSSIQENIGLSSYGKTLKAQTAPEAVSARGASCRLRTQVWWQGPSPSLQKHTHLPTKRNSNAHLKLNKCKATHTNLNSYSGDSELS